MIQIGEQLNDQGIAYGMRYDELRAVLTRHFKELLERKKAEIAIVGRLTDDDREHYLARLQETQSAIDTDQPLSASLPEDVLLSNFIRKYDLAINNSSPQYSWLQRDLKRSFRSYIQAVLNYDTSLDHFDLGEPALPAPPAMPAKPEKEPTRSERGVTIANLAGRFTRERSLGNNWAARTKLEKQDHIDLLKEILGAERDIRTLSATDVTQVKDTLTNIPKNRNKNRLTRGRPLAEVLTMHNLEKLQVPSINKYLQTYSDLFEYARQHSLVERNWFSGLAIKQNRQRTQTNRTAFSTPQVRLLIGNLTEPSSIMIRKPYQKWGPLIGLYTGARLNEIAQIDLADIRQQDGIWVFDLNDEGDDKQLKTASSRRLVPIHDKLIEYGLLEYVESLRRMKKQKLFPDLPNTVEHGRGRNIGRWFNESFLPKLKIKNNALVFHSLRHTVITRLMQTDTQESVVKALVGHAQQGVTQQNYFKEGYTLKQLSEALQKLDYHTAE